MPIKFRCDHCRQFLGISHKKAGMLVDCPNCGRTIRVPDPEGKVQPLPELKLNLKDSKLATALEELASIGRDDGVNAEQDSDVEISDKQPQPNQTAAEELAAPIAPPVAPVPIRVEPVIAPKPIPVEMPDSRKPAPVASMQELSALANLPTRDAAAEQPVVDVEMPLARPAERQIIKQAGTSRLVIAVLIGFIVGFGAGRWDRSSVKNLNGVDGKPGDNQKAAAPDPFAENSKSAVRGRITYQTDSGERKPDRGARVLLLPEKREGTTKLAVAGFRATDSDNNSADSKLAAASLRALGGDVATVDDAGNFEFSSRPAGTYRILALSHFQPRDDRTPVEQELKLLLDSYFDKPEQLLGKCRYRLDTVKVSGNQPVTWDHPFERE